MALHAGMIIGNRYKLIHSIGKGGMASIHLANDLRLERTVAVKILNPKFSMDQDFRLRFSQEAKAAANLIHPNLVTIYDFGEDESNVFIVMEYVPGTDLKAVLAANKEIELPTSLSLMMQACAGVGYAHRAGLIHCDLKPQNMLITKDFRLKVTDFGIARAFSTIEQDEKNDIVWGSPYYISPEQASGRAPSPASDVYSLGVVFYELLTGQLPFKATSADEMIDMQINSIPENPSKFNPKVPNEIDGLIQKVLSKEPTARYRTADQFGRVITLLSQKYPQKETFVPMSLDVEQFSTHEEITQKISVGGVDQKLNLSFAGLLLLALLLVGGLFPFWLFVILSLKSGL